MTLLLTDNPTVMKGSQNVINGEMYGENTLN